MRAQTLDPNRVALRQTFSPDVMVSDQKRGPANNSGAYLVLAKVHVCRIEVS